MKLNKQSNVYTVVYIIVMVLVVGTALAFTALSLRDRQQANADADKMRQILASARITVAADSVLAVFDSHITATPVYDSLGRKIADNAFDIDVAAESKKPESERQLPVFVCQATDSTVKYILPLYGAGLWGPIWGYIAFDADGSTVYGAYFAHQGETPGLGAEIEKPSFSHQFEGKEMFKGDRFMPVTVVKKGQKPTGDEDYVDGISGGTITSKGVAAMIDNCLVPYQAFLKSLSKQ